MLNNRRIILVARILLFVLAFVIIIDLFFSQLSGSLSEYFEGHVPAFISMGIMVLLLFINPRYFSFRDEHEFLHIQSRSGLMPIGEVPAEVNFEFLKKNIRDYHIHGWGSHLKLHLKLSSEYRGKDEYCFVLSFMSKDQVKQLRNALKRATRESSKENRQRLVSVG